MMHPPRIPQGADPSRNVACVDAKRLRCSAVPTDPASKVLNDDDSTSSWPVLVPPLDDDNILEEILLRLPPKPSSLPRASLVSIRWRGILSDPEFLKRYRKHHRKPPLLGFFARDTSTCHRFVPLLGVKPDCIPAERFACPKNSRPYQHWHFLGCRHGLAILLNECQREVIVWDPLTGQQHRVPFPPGLSHAQTDIFCVWHAAVLCANAEDGHVHGDCFSCPFKLVLTCGGDTQASACLYESASGVWGNIASTVTMDAIGRIRPSVHIGNNTLFWLLCGGGVIVFDIERQNLDVIQKPLEAHSTGCYSFQLLRTNDSALGFAVLSELSIQLWKRKLNCEGVVEWVMLQKIIQLDGLFQQGLRSDLKKVLMVGYDEESNLIVLATYFGEFMLDPEAMRFKRISERSHWDYKIHHPYINFYTAGRGVGWKWVDQELSTPEIF